MKATRCQECGFFTETTRCQHCGSIVVPKQPMTKDELRKGLRETFSLPNERNLFWRYIGQLEQRIKELEEPILCHKCNDHIYGDGAICGACASTQDIVINEQRERIAELEAMSIDEFALLKHQQEFGE